MDELYDDWNVQKKHLRGMRFPFFRERDVFWARLGMNVGCEQNGKHKDFLRPVLVLRKFSKHSAFCIPLTSKKKEGAFYCEIAVLSSSSPNWAILSQGRLLDARRFSHRMGAVNKKDFLCVKKKLSKLLIL